MNKLHQQLVKLRSITEEIHGLLYQDKAALVIERLKARTQLLELLQKKELGILDSTRDEIKILVKQIVALDKKNMAVVSKSLKEIGVSIAELAKEKQTMNDLRVLAKAGQKQIVDVFY